MKSNDSSNIYSYVIAVLIILVAYNLVINNNNDLKKNILFTADYTRDCPNSEYDDRSNNNNSRECEVSSPPSGFMYFSFGDFVADQANLAIESQRHQQQQHKGDYHYLRIDSNPFTKTVPTSLDHVKWLALTNRTFEIPSVDQELVCRYNVRLQTFNTDKHPFGDAVLNAESDLRLASAAVNSLDFNTMLVADFLLTNTQIYVVYERLPFIPNYEYASFTFAVPVRQRSQQTEFVELAIAWDAEHKIVRWLIDNREVYRISSVGYRISREYLLIDRGGREELVFPKSVQCGAGTFSILDGSSPCSSMQTTIGGGSGCITSAPLQKGLVKLDQNGPEYIAPLKGTTNQTFVDEESKESSRVYGQGAILDIKYIQVYTQSNKQNV